MTVAFLLTSLAIVATPGTGAILTISAGLAAGRRHALVTAVGCTLGIVPHLAAAVTGTAALLRAGGTAFEILKVAGVAYLLFLAWATWRDSHTLTLDLSARPASTSRTIANAFKVDLCALPGDSGGVVFSGDKALGVSSASNVADTGTCANARAVARAAGFTPTLSVVPISDVLAAHPGLTLRTN